VPIMSAARTAGARCSYRGRAAKSGTDCTDGISLAFRKARLRPNRD
jgi:hypothetical protein